jgi:hypothetical protein
MYTPTMHLKHFISSAIALSLSLSAAPALARKTDQDDVNRNTRIKQVDLPAYILERRASTPNRSRTLKPKTQFIGKTAAQRVTQSQRALLKQQNALQAKTLRKRLEQLSGSGTVQAQ